ncbi:MAG TPA: hypothetical protein VJJ78_02270 [Candidatus Saccharimonadales bacterium]|nr:hypothetical protein [Candidatus Saccharimonadales bacterium]
MTKLDNRGVVNTLLIPLIVIGTILLAAAIFAIWAYSGRQDFKNNVDKKIETAVEIAKKQTASAKDNEFVEKEKNPLKTYRGPEAYGSVVVKYPKTWSAYVVEGGNSSNPVDGYFNPDFVPGVQTSSVYALRIQVVPSAYDRELDRYDAFVQKGTVKVAPFRFPKVKSIVGVRLNGEIANGKQGSLILVPLRDKTLKVFTETNSFVADFNKFILPNLKFSP